MVDFQSLCVCACVGGEEGVCVCVCAPWILECIVLLELQTQFLKQCIMIKDADSVFKSLNFVLEKLLCCFCISNLVDFVKEKKSPHLTKAATFILQSTKWPGVWKHRDLSYLSEAREDSEHSEFTVSTHQVYLSICQCTNLLNSAQMANEPVNLGNCF